MHESLVNDSEVKSECSDVSDADEDDDVGGARFSDNLSGEAAQLLEKDEATYEKFGKFLKLIAENDESLRYSQFEPYSHATRELPKLSLGSIMKDFSSGDFGKMKQYEQNYAIAMLKQHICGGSKLENDL